MLLNLDYENLKERITIMVKILHMKGVHDYDTIFHIFLTRNYMFITLN